MRGIKNGGIEIMRCQEGGFIRVPRPNSRLKLAKLLEEHSDVKQAIDKYRSVDRPLHYPNPIVSFKHFQVREQEQETKRLIDLHNNRAPASTKITPCDINDSIRDFPLHHITRDQIHHSRHRGEVYDSQGNIVVKKKLANGRKASYLQAVAGSASMSKEAVDEK